MARSTVRLEGFKELDYALQELPKSIGKSLVRRVLLKAGKTIAEAGAANAPLGPTGNLKASYGVGTKLTRRQRKMNKRESPVEVHVGPNDPAAIQTEFGNEHQAAEPHLRPAWDATKNQVLDTIKTELATAIGKAATRLARKAARDARRAAGQ